MKNSSLEKLSIYKHPFKNQTWSLVNFSGSESIAREYDKTSIPFAGISLINSAFIKQLINSHIHAGTTLDIGPSARGSDQTLAAKQKPNVLERRLASVNSDIWFLKNTHLQKVMVSKLKNIFNSEFLTSANNYLLRSKLSNEYPVRVPVKLFSQNNPEVEHLEVQGVGWAGQPIVKRVHPILPEVYGDLADTSAIKKIVTCPNDIKEHYFYSSTQSTVSTPKHLIKEQQAGGQNEAERFKEFKSNHALKNTVVESNVKSVEVEMNEHSLKNKHSDDNSLNSKGNASLSNFVFHSDGNIPNWGKPSLNKYVEDNNMNSRIYRNAEILEQSKKTAGLASSKDNHRKTDKLSMLAVENHIRKRKKVKVCTVKPVSINLIQSNKVKTQKKKKKSANKKSNLNSQLLLNQRASAQVISRNIQLIGNRHLHTSSVDNAVKASVELKFKENTKNTLLTGKNKKGKKKNEFNLFEVERYPDDCVCPDTKEIQNRTNTKICGEAEGAEKLKKKKGWKPKMCLVEPKIKHKKSRTLVCLSAKFKKGAKKRQLPKCVKPEKKEASRVLVCPPVLEDELAAKEKKCVKVEEEVKVRSRTTVCRPIIMYAKEESVKIQKSVCTEKKVKKVKSRHTTICQTSEDIPTKKKKLGVR